MCAGGGRAAAIGGWRAWLWGRTLHGLAARLARGEGSRDGGARRAGRASLRAATLLLGRVAAARDVVGGALDGGVDGDGDLARLLGGDGSCYGRHWGKVCSNALRLLFRFKHID